jgi:hypothetical protein
MGLKQRGRKSSASLMARQAVDEGPPAVRPDPPERLDETEAAEWRAIVNRMPPDWFSRETHSVLETLCCQTVSLRMIQEKIRRIRAGHQPDPDDFTLKELLKLQIEGSNSVVTLSVKLRLTLQSRYMPVKATEKILKNVDQPWDLTDAA